MTPSPSPEKQIEFLVQLQRLLDEGQFTASYKFALLLSFADLSVEKGDDSGAPLALSMDEIAEKFIRYYWRQVLPHPASAGTILQQNKGNQAKIVNRVQQARRTHGDSIAKLMASGKPWRELLSEVRSTVRGQPVRYLQNVGGERLEFLFTRRGRVIELRPGVAFCFRKFHALITDLVRSAWVRYVRQQNLGVLGEATDLNEFLFGTERATLKAVRPVLTEVQGGKCFYCPKVLTDANVHVDHFIPWSRYPVDLGHNFVLADSACNGKKRERLPSCDHLERWVERNRKHDGQLTSSLRGCGIVADLAASNRVAHWAYSQTAIVGGLTWLRGDEMIPLAEAWEGLLEVHG
jgi:hypothetical protein